MSVCWHSLEDRCFASRRAACTSITAQLSPRACLPASPRGCWAPAASPAAASPSGWWRWAVRPQRRAAAHLHTCHTSVDRPLNSNSDNVHSTILWMMTLLLHGFVMNLENVGTSRVAISAASFRSQWVHNLGVAPPQAAPTRLWRPPPAPQPTPPWRRPPSLPCSCGRLHGWMRLPLTPTRPPLTTAAASDSCCRRRSFSQGSLRCPYPMATSGPAR